MATYQKIIDHYSGYQGLWIDKYDKRVIYPDLYIRRNKYVEKIISRDSQVKNKNCLDFGCGYGDVALALASYFKEVYGSDIVPHNIEQSKKNAEKLGINNAYFALSSDITPFENDYFDYVLLLDVFEHFEESDRSPYLQEVRRILKPSGTMLLITPDRKTIKLLEKIDNFFLFFFGQKENILNNPVNHFLTIKDMKKNLADNNFKLSSIDRICFYPAAETWGFFAKINKLAVLMGLGKIFNYIFRFLFYQIVERLKFLNQKVVYIAHK